MSSNSAGRESGFESIPENAEKIFNEAKGIAIGQGLEGAGHAQFGKRHAFCPAVGRCTTSNVVYKHSISGAVDFLASRPDYNALLGSEIGGTITVYPLSTAPRMLPFVFGMDGYKESLFGGPLGVYLNPVESVVGVIAHETGHYVGMEHGRRMDMREHNSIQRMR